MAAEEQNGLLRFVVVFGRFGNEHLGSNFYFYDATGGRFVVSKHSRRGTRNLFLDCYSKFRAYVEISVLT